MRKYTSMFLVFAAFFFAALAITVAYSRHPKTASVETVHPVALLGDHAEPGQLIIRTGETVRFDNGDQIDHDIHEKAEDDGAAAISLRVPPAGNAKLQFNHAGTFNYFDALHPAITIKVIVYDPAK